MLDVTTIRMIGIWTAIFKMGILRHQLVWQDVGHFDLSTPGYKQLTGVCAEIPMENMEKLIIAI